MGQSTLRPSPTALINPRCDPLFKAIFTQGTAESNLALQDFISALLGHTVTELQLQPNEPPVETLDQMQMTFDVSVVFDDGERADLEIQSRSREYDYGIRSEVQAARLLNNNAKKGSNWNAPKIYQISVLNFEYAKDDKSPLAWYSMRKDDGKALGGRLNVIYFDLVKIRRLLGTPVSELTNLEKWGLYLSFADDERHQSYVKEIAESEKGIMAANFIVKRMSEEDANWFRQNSYDTAMRDRNAERENAIKKGHEEGLQKGIQKGLQKGIQEGLQKGIQEGLTQGIQQGLAQGRKTGYLEATRDAARKFHANGISVEIIAKSLGISEVEVRGIIEGAGSDS